MKLTWKQVECAKCKSCMITRHGKPRIPKDFVCGNCLSDRLNRKHERTSEIIFNIYRIANQFVKKESAHVVKDNGNDYLAWLEELVKIGEDAITAIEKELKRNKKDKDNTTTPQPHKDTQHHER